MSATTLLRIVSGSGPRARVRRRAISRTDSSSSTGECQFPAAAPACREVQGGGQVKPRQVWSPLMVPTNQRSAQEHVTTRTDLDGWAAHNGQPARRADGPCCGRRPGSRQADGPSGASWRGRGPPGPHCARPPGRRKATRRARLETRRWAAARVRPGTRGVYGLW